MFSDRNLLVLGPLAFVFLAAVGFADGPKDNSSVDVRPIPPIGIPLPESERRRLANRCDEVRQQWSALKLSPEQTAHAGEVLVFPRAVELAIEFEQFYKKGDIKAADALLDQATERMKRVQSGADWAKIVGIGEGNIQQLVVGGFRSKIDDSIQPYGLIIPAGYNGHDVRPRRLDIWFHGRGETQSEVAFLTKQQNNAGQYHPTDTFVLHPYGRYCNAFKFAGEVDVLEALEHVRSRLPIDKTRISVRGFSMGGAACWQFATRYADRWFAANPGAGFSETPEFLRTFQGEDVAKVAPDHQQRLWQLYDNPEWAINLAQCPTIAYSGEVDRQKQAADAMESALQKHDVDLVHVIGAGMGHKIDEASKMIIEDGMNELARQTTAAIPRSVSFSTFTLKYHRMAWVDVRGLNEHWRSSRVDASIVDDQTITAETTNINRLCFRFESGQWPGLASGRINLRVDGQALQGPPVRSDRSYLVEVERIRNDWKLVDQEAKEVASTFDVSKLRKRPGLQGPIDDAFMDRFLFVLPNGKSLDPQVQAWVEQESAHAMLHWRKHFRGDIQRTTDAELTEAQIRDCHLVIFGDPNSNSTIAKIAPHLPIRWDTQRLSIGKSSTDSSGHVPILVYPNPLNPERYVVINSGFTFREYDYLNNARQTPKLPDWAIVDVREGSNFRDPGRVIDAGFFDERWRP
ncbi:MAG: prolyl oligopeptidase family serine peptidase [Planctomycetota bacterium]